MFQHLSNIPVGDGSTVFPMSGYQSGDSGAKPPAATDSPFSAAPLSQAPVPVEPISIDRAELVFRGKAAHRFVAGTQRKVLLSFKVDAQMMSVEITVQLGRVDEGFGDVCVCWCSVLEDIPKLQVLNRLIG